MPTTAPAPQLPHRIKDRVHNALYTCNRCNGMGDWHGRGVCYGCGGAGVFRWQRPLTAQEVAANRVRIQQEEAAADEARRARRAARDAARPVLEAQVGRPVTFTELGAFLRDGTVPAP